MNKFINKLRLGNHKQLKLLRIKPECIEDVFNLIEIIEDSQKLGRDVDWSASIRRAKTGSTSRTRRYSTTTNDLTGTSTKCRSQAMKLLRMNPGRMNASRELVFCVEREGTESPKVLSGSWWTSSRTPNRTARSHDTEEEYKFPVIEAQVRFGSETRNLGRR